MSFENLSDAELDQLVVEKISQQSQQPQNDFEKLTDDELDQLVLQKMGAQPTNNESDLSAVEAGVSGFAQGLTFGGVPALEAATEPAIQDAMSFVAGLFGKTNEDVNSELERQGFNIKDEQPDFEQRKAQSKERIEGLRQEHPKTFAASEIGATLLPVSGPAKLFRGADIAVSKIPKIGKATGLIGRSTKGTASAAAGMAGMQGAEKLTGAREEFDDMAIDTAAAIGGTLPVAGAALRAIPKIPSKLLSVFGGVDQKTVKNYVANAERINKAPNKEKVVEEIERVAFNIQNDLNKKIKTKEQLEAVISELKKEVNDNLIKKRIDLSAKLSEVETRLNNTFNNKVDNLKNISSLSNISDDVFNSIGTLKEKVIGGSAAAREILETTSGTMKSSVIKRYITQAEKRLKVGGKTAIGSTSKAAVNKLQTLKDDISKLGDEVNYQDVKKILQSLDDDINFALNNNQFSKAFDGAAASIRRNIDKNLKRKVPEYRKAMEKVADDTKILSQANKIFKDKDATTRSLKSILKPERKTQLEVLNKLGEKTGLNFKSSVDKANKARVKTLTKEGQRKLKEDLPDFKEAQQIKGEIASRRRPEFKKDVMQGAIVKKQKRLEKLKKEIIEMKAETAPTKRLTGVEGATSTVNTFVTSHGRRNRGIIRKISKLADKDFNQILKDISTKEAFTKDATRGSRNVNLWAIVGAASGAFSGPVGAAIGATIGAIADKFGPHMSKKILDASLKIKLPVTVEKINKLKLPENAKKYMRDQLLIQSKNID